MTLILRVSGAVSKEGLPQRLESFFTEDHDAAAALATDWPTKHIHPAPLTASRGHFNYMITPPCFPRWAGRLQKSWTFFPLQLPLTSLWGSPAKSPQWGCYQHTEGIPTESHTWIQILPLLLASGMTSTGLPISCHPVLLTRKIAVAAESDQTVAIWNTWVRCWLLGYEVW